MNTAIGLILARSWMNVCGLLSFLVVARFVTPAEIGIYALASSVILLPTSLVGAGYSEHVISRDPERRDTATAFWSVIATGVIGTLLGLAAAIASDALLDQPEIARIIALMAPLPLLWAVTVVPEAVLIRDGRGSALAAVPFTADTLGLLALVAVLLIDGGVMALVVNRLVSSAVLLAGYLGAARFPPRLWHFDLAAARRIGWFSLGVVGSRLAGWGNQFGTEIIIGVVLSTTAVGYFRMASRLAGALFSIVTQGPTPAQLAYFGRSTAAPHKAYLHALRLHLSLVMPILIGAALAAPTLIEVLLGPTWQPSALVFSILCIGSLSTIGSGIGATLLISRGRSHRVFMIHTATAIATVAAMLLGAQFGLAATAIAKLLVVTVFFGVTACAIEELRPSGLRQTMRVLGATAVPGVAMAMAMAIVLLLWPAPTEAVIGLLRITLAGVLGLAAYVAMTLLALRRTATLWRVLLLKKWGRRRRLPRILGRGWRFGTLSP
jgi:O-antigen/teichoic acid export membrane protein